MEDLDRGWVLETSKLNTMAAAARRSWGGSCLGAPGTPGQGGDLLAEPGLLAPPPPQAGSKAHSNWGTLFGMHTCTCPQVCAQDVASHYLKRQEQKPIPPGPAEGQLYVNWPFMVSSQP